jgi:hypothetical protein
MHELMQNKNRIVNTLFTEMESLEGETNFELKAIAMMTLELALFVRIEETGENRDGGKLVHRYATCFL